MEAKTALKQLDDLIVQIPIRQFEEFVQGVMGRCTILLAESRIYHDISESVYEPIEPDLNDPRR